MSPCPACGRPLLSQPRGRTASLPSLSGLPALQSDVTFKYTMKWPGEVRSHRATTWAPVPWTLPALPGSPGRRAWESRSVANLIEMRCPTSSYILMLWHCTRPGVEASRRDSRSRSPLQVMTIFKAAPRLWLRPLLPGMVMPCPTATPGRAHESRYSQQGFICTGPRAGDQMNQSGYSPSNSSPHLIFTPLISNSRMSSKV